MTDKNTKSEEEVKVEVAETSNSAPGNNPLAVPISIVIAGVIIALAIMFSNGGGGGSAPTGNAGAANQPAGPTEEEKLELAALEPGDHIRGAENPEVYILEFSDTECPFCKRFHETMKQVIAEYGDRVAWVYRHFPLAQLHPTAERESEALECAGELGGNEKFWEYTDQIYEQTPDSSALRDEQLGEIAAQVGLDRVSFEECLNSGRYTAEVQKDVQNALDLGGRGTPHSLIVAGDKIVPINGAQPYSVVKASLDAVLK